MAKRRKDKIKAELEQEFDFLVDTLKQMGDILTEVGLDSYEEYKELEVKVLKQLVANTYENMATLPSIMDFNYSYIMSEEMGKDNLYEYAKERANKSDKELKKFLADIYTSKEKGILKVEKPKGIQDYYNALCKLSQNYSSMYGFFSNKTKREFCNDMAKAISKTDEVAVDEEAIARTKAHLDIIKLTETLCGQALEAEQKTNSNMPEESFVKTITRYNKRIKGSLSQLISSFKQNFVARDHGTHIDALDKVYEILATSLDAKIGIIEKWAERILPEEQLKEEEVVVGSKHATQSVQEAKVAKAVDKANELFNRISQDYVRDLQTYIDQTKLPEKNSFKKSLNGLVESYNKFASTMPLAYTVTEGEAKTKIDQMNRWIDRFYDVSSANAASEAYGCGR